MGVIGEADDDVYYVGNKRLFEELFEGLPEEAQRLEEDGNAMVLVGSRGEP